MLEVLDIVIIQEGLNPTFEILKCSVQAGIAVFALVNSAAQIVGSNKSRNHFISPNFNPAIFSNKAIDNWVLLFKGFRFGH